MRLPLAARLSSPAARTGLYYTSLFSTGAVANPFLPIWLSDKGIDETYIGLVNAAPIFAMIALNLIVGRIADKANDWRSVIVFGSVFATVPPVLLLFSDGLWPILIIWTLVIVPFQAIAPIVDAATYRMSRRQSLNFGAIRVWGTLGFIVTTLIAGFVLDLEGAVAFVPLLIVVCAIRAVLSLQLPLFRGGEEAAHRPHYPIDAPISPLVAVRIGELWRPWFLLTMLGAALLHASHMMQMAFGALIWAEAGLSGLTIGLLWASAPAGEILAMLFFERLSKRFAARHIIFVACVCGALRWFGMGLEPNVWVLLVLQLLHMATMGLGFLGITNFIANWTTEDIAAEAQSFFVMIRQVVTVVALLSFGVLAETFGAGGFYVAAAGSAVGAVLVVASLRLMNPKYEQAELKGMIR
ncbi:MFS transporter [Devosia pacifica]|uniref:MFS transporter n=1 Tax=Devosia pacifica TaxID=1335967 RepID=A0A918VQS2_9HYPH|nr:MFS transporter [Devosia pacifica]GHA14938.1 MFS transporter [Devosia pacifica]